MNGRKEKWDASQLSPVGLLATDPVTRDGTFLQILAPCFAVAAWEKRGAG